MTRLALGANCSALRMPPDAAWEGGTAGAAATEPKRPGFSSEARAAAPMPAVVRPKNCRRVRRSRRSWSCSIDSISSLRHPPHPNSISRSPRRPSRQFGMIQLLHPAAIPPRTAAFPPPAGLCDTARLAARTPLSTRPSPPPTACGPRAAGTRRRCGLRGVLPSCIIRSASLRIASTYVGSFISTSACSGVLVRARRTVHTSRSGASNVDRAGGGLVPFQKVYIVRRYKSLPWLCW